MMRMIKDYRAITNGKYRLWCNVLIPVILGAIPAWIVVGVWTKNSASLAIGVVTMFLAAVEIVADYWGFGAICVKGCLGMDYLKTSTKGKAMLKNALMMDLLVRPVRIAICMAIVCIPYGILVGNPAIALCMSILLIANVSVWALNITRYIQNIHAISTLAPLVSAGIAMAVLYMSFAPTLQKFVWLIVAALVVLLAAGIFVTSRHMYHKVEASYRDAEK